MDQYIEFAGNHPYLVGAAVMLAALILFNELRLRTRGFADIAPVDAVRLINVDAVVLDVRGADAYANGHIVGARSTPLDEIDVENRTIAKLKDKPVLTYCDNGTTGGRAAAMLRKADFTRVFNLRGGLEAWRRENYPLTED